MYYRVYLYVYKDVCLATYRYKYRQSVLRIVFIFNRHAVYKKKKKNNKVDKYITTFIFNLTLGCVKLAFIFICIIIFL